MFSDVDEYLLLGNEPDIPKNNNLDPGYVFCNGLLNREGIAAEYCDSMLPDEDNIYR